MKPEHTMATYKIVIANLHFAILKACDNYSPHSWLTIKLLFYISAVATFESTNEPGNINNNFGGA